MANEVKAFFILVGLILFGIISWIFPIVAIIAVVVLVLAMVYYLILALLEDDGNDGGYC